MTNNKKTSYFPKFPRLITEKKIRQYSEKLWFRLQRRSKLIYLISAILIFFLSLILFFGITAYGVNLVKSYKKFVKITNERQILQSEINFWQSVNEKYDGYKDAYFRKALLEYRLSQYDKAKEDNKKALNLDPNYEDAKKLEKVLENY
jgi:tetratricopeptide (TPR) repeat protein